MSLGGGGTQTVNNDPWEGLQPFLTGQPAIAPTPGTPGYTDDAGNRIPGTPGTPGQEAITGILPEALRLYEAGGAQQFPGQRITDLSPNIIQGRESATNVANNILPQLINQTQGTQSFLSSSDLLRPDANPYLAQTANAAIQPIVNQLTQSILPQISGGAIQAGGFGGDRQGVFEAKAVDDFTRNVGNITSGIYSNAYSQGLDTMLQGLALSPQTLGLQTLPSSILQSVGAGETAYDQALLDDEISRFNYEQNLPWMNLERYTNLLNPYTGFGSSTSESGQNPLTAGLMGGLGTYGLLETLNPGMAANPWLGGGVALLSMLNS